MHILQHIFHSNREDKSFILYIHSKSDHKEEFCHTHLLLDPDSLYFYKYLQEP